MYKSTAKSWLINGSCIGPILALPFGPLGVLAGSLLGMVVGLCGGLIVDLVKLQRKQTTVEVQKVRVV